MSDQLETFVTFGEDDRRKVTGSVHRFAKGLIVFELPHSGAVLRASAILPNFSITIYGRGVYSGKAVVHGLIETGKGVICETVNASRYLSPVILSESNKCF